MLTLPPPSRMASLLQQHATGDVELSLVARTDTKKLQEAHDVVFKAFSEPFYKLMAWVGEPVREDKRETANKDWLAWVVKYCVACSYETHGYVLRASDRSTGQVLGTALVAACTPFSSNPVVSFFQHLSVATKMYGWKVGVPTGIRKIATYGIGHARRTLACSTLEEERIAVMGESEPYFYLQQLAVLPSAQGRGVGSTMLALIGAVADDLQQKCYLETDEPHLKAFYSNPRNGYTCHHEYVVKAGGDEFKPNYAMVRLPRVSGGGGGGGEEQIVQS